MKILGLMASCILSFGTLGEAFAGSTVVYQSIPDLRSGVYNNDCGPCEAPGNYVGETFELSAPATINTVEVVANQAQPIPQYIYTIIYQDGGSDNFGDVELNGGLAVDRVTPTGHGTEIITMFMSGFSVPLSAGRYDIIFQNTTGLSLPSFPGSYGDEIYTPPNPNPRLIPLGSYYPVPNADIGLLLAFGAPEPSVWVMLLLGFGAIGIRRRAHNRMRPLEDRSAVST